MYCKNCGKLVSEGALFCTYCGAKAEPAALTNAPDSSPETASQPIQETTAQTAISESPAPIDTTTPRPAENISTGTGSTPVESPVCASVEFRPEKAVEPKAEKHFTWLHIGLCLAAVAVMAIVAGIFAGLYFSLL